MDWLQDRRLMLTVGGGVLALLIALVLAFGLSSIGHKTQAPPPPASVGGLVVQMGAPQDAKLDPKQPLRCFVNGQFVGMEPLADCAKQNGVATKALDVGVDPNAVTGGPDASLAPPPPSDMPPPAQVAVPDQAAPAAASASRAAIGDCLRYGPSGWRKVADGVSLSACVQTLYAGHCEKVGGASYGRWGVQTLRLLPHVVQASSDNKNFNPLVEQSDSCVIADF